MKESETKRIEFPDKDPEEWELFLQCIDNASPLLFQLNEDDFYKYDTEPHRDERINFSNVRALIPLFHEFQMEKYLHRCDLEAKRGIDCVTAASQDKEMARLFQVLSVSINKYNLVGTMNICPTEILLRFMWGLGDRDHFNFSIVQHMVEISYPFHFLNRIAVCTNLLTMY